MAIDIGVEWYRRESSGLLDGNYDPSATVYRHGDVFSFHNDDFGSNSATKRIFAGGAGGIIETPSVGATIEETSDWSFTIASHKPVVYNDSVRGKVMRNDYNNQTDLDATHTAIFGSSLGYGTNIYLSRWIKPIVKTSGDVNYPAGAETLQLKLVRLNTAFDIVDTNDNSGTECAIFRGWGTQSSISRYETGDGILSVTSTSTGSSTLIDSSKNFPTNFLNHRGLSIQSGAAAGDYSAITSNTATVITPEYSFSHALGIGDTATIEHAARYLASDDIDVNQGWQREETIIKTNSANAADGTLIRRIWKSDGVHQTLSASNIVFYAGAGRFNYVHFQNYFGNNSVAMPYREMLSDDLTVIIGAPNNRRLILSDTLDLANNSLSLNDQNWTTWSAGDISLPLNTHGLSASGTYYVLAVENANTVIGYQPISIEV